MMTHVIKWWKEKTEGETYFRFSNTCSNINYVVVLRILLGVVFGLLFFENSICQNNSSYNETVNEYIFQLKNAGGKKILQMNNNAFSSIIVWENANKVFAARMFYHNDKVVNKRIWFLKSIKGNFNLVMNNFDIFDFTPTNCLEQAHSFQIMNITIYNNGVERNGVLYSNCRIIQGDEFRQCLWDIYCRIK